MAKGKKAAAAKGQPCGCGCGKITLGGEFKPGHDARHKGNLARKVIAGGAGAVSARAELKKREWLSLVNLERKPAKVKPVKKAKQAKRVKPQAQPVVEEAK